MNNFGDRKIFWEEILEILSIPVIIINRDGEIVFFNKGAREFLGYNEKDIIFRKIYTIISASAKPLLESLIKKAEEKSEPSIVENILPFVKKDGEVVSIHTSFACASSNDEFYGIFVLKLKNRKDFDLTWLKALVEQANVAIEVTDAEGNIIYVNPEFERSSGYTREELLGKNSRILKSEKRDKAFYEELWSTISSGKVWKGIFINKRKDGTFYYADAVIFPIKDDNEEIIGYGSMGVDVTEKVKMEEEIKERTKKLEELQAFLVKMASKSLSEEYTFIDFVKEILEKAAELIDADKVLMLMFNESHDQLKPIDVYFKREKVHKKGFITTKEELPLYFEKAKREMEEFLIINKTHNPALMEELARFAQRCGVKDVGSSIIDVPLRSNKEVIGTLSFAKFDPDKEWSLDEQIFAKYIADIVTLKLEQYNKIKMEKALIEAREEAESANRAKTTFLSQMSHELRTPLNAILGFSQLLYEEMLGPLNESQKDALKDVLKSGHHLLELINEILDLSKIESGRITLSIEDIHISDLITEVIDLSRPLAVNRGIRIINEVPKGVYVKGDYTRLKQVFINLLSNAIKYNKDEGYVEIGIEESDKIIKVMVEDSGIGIPKDKLDRLFNPFDRLGREATSLEGTGIGLAITKKLVELMGGSIEVKSKAGQGSTFTVSLIRAEGIFKKMERDMKDIRSSEHVDKRKKYKILYIEDNLSNLKLVTKIFLKRPEVKLITSGQGRVGIDLALTHKPDLILVDINLPDISGHEVLERLREIEELKDTRIIAISADVLGMNKEKAKKKGFDDFIPKPIDVKQFLSIIDNYLSRA